MLERVTELMSSDAANSYWKPLTPYLLTEGTYRVGQVTRQINTYWRDGMCQEAHDRGPLPLGARRGADRPHDDAHDRRRGRRHGHGDVQRHR